uniref:UMOD/GP2/OIT3-like D8C domain-containing protein n=1 Tax=Neogobius melanostomus TaxID=47308 RepID=A0A8C6TYX9_9GOBI
MNCFLYTQHLTCFVTGTHALIYPTAAKATEAEDRLLGGNEESKKRKKDPCFHYTAIDQGKSLQMPERCVMGEKCGTHAPLWLSGSHPKRRNGIVTRQVCGSWKKKCCAFRSTPIKVKKCRGNYFVYKFSRPSTCYLAYCTGVRLI